MLIFTKLAEIFFAFATFGRGVAHVEGLLASVDHVDEVHFFMVETLEIRATSQVVSFGAAIGALCLAHALRMGSSGRDSRGQLSSLDGNFTSSSKSSFAKWLRS